MEKHVKENYFISGVSFSLCSQYRGTGDYEYRLSDWQALGNLKFRSKLICVNTACEKFIRRS